MQLPGPALFPQQPIRTPRSLSSSGGMLSPATPRFSSSLPPQTPRSSGAGAAPPTPSGRSRSAAPVLRPEDEALARRLVSMGLISSHALAAQFIAAASVPQVCVPWWEGGTVG